MNGRCNSRIYRLRQFLSPNLFGISFAVAGWMSAQGATDLWTNAQGGNWGSGTNWSLGAAPGTGDTAVITAAGAYTVDLIGSAQVANLILGGTTASPTLIVNDGTLTLPTGGTVASNGTLTLNGASFSGLLTVSGTFDWNNGGNISAGSAVTILSNAVLNLNGNSEQDLYGVLTNAGTINWPGTASLYIYNSSSEGWAGGIVNLPGALFNDQNDQILGGGFGSPYFNNEGTFVKSAGTNTTISVAFYNSGALNLTTTTVTIANGGTDNGTVTGSGTLNLTGGTLTLDGTIPNLSVSSGILDGVNATISNLTWSSGTLEGTNTITVSADWSGGTIGAGSTLTVATNAVMDITGNGGDGESLYGVLTNAGTVNWSGTAYIEIYNLGYEGWTGGMVNLAGATFNDQNDQTMENVEGSSFFDNFGTFLKSAGTNTSISAQFNNSGVVDVEVGTVNFANGGSGNGIFTGAGTSSMTGGTMTVSGSAQNLAIAGATVDGVNATISNLTWSSGTLNGTNILSGSSIWTGGSIGVEGSLTVSSNAVLNIAGNYGVFLSGMLTNAGTVNWSGTGTIYFYNEALQDDGGIVNLPGAIFNAQNDATMTDDEGSPVFNNEGAFLKSAGTNTTIGVTFNNSGVVNVEIGTVSFVTGGSGNGLFTGAGTTSVTGSTLTIAGAVENLAIAGGTVDGVNASISNLNFTSGTLNGNNVLTGSASWTGGSLGGESSLTVSNNAVLTIGGSYAVFLSGMLTNAGTVNWSGTGSIYVYNYGLQGANGGIVNLAGAMFNAQNDAMMVNDEGSPLFYNAGTLLKSAGTNSIIGLTFNNSGVVSVASGTIIFAGGGSGNGPFLGPGSSGVTAGTMTLGGPVQNLVLAGGTIVGLNESISNLTWTSGTVEGSNILTGTSSWTSGSLNGLSSVTVSNNGVLNINAGGGGIYFYGMLTNAGTVNWSGTGTLLFYYYGPQSTDGGIVNLAGAVFDAQSDAAMAGDGGSPFFYNAGAFVKSAGTNTTIGLAFTNMGAIDLSLSSPSNFGRINFSATVAIGGVVNINYNNNYSPSTGDYFPLLTYPSETGVFSAVNLPALLPWQTNTLTYGPSVFSLAIGSIYKLAFTSGPAATNIAGAPFPAIVVQAQYLDGTPFATNGVALAIAMPSGSGTLSGTLTQNTDSAGAATFANLSVNLIGPKILEASSPPWITPTSNTVLIIPAAPAQLLITAPIASLQKQGYAFSPDPKVQVLDQFGNVVSNSAALITAASTSTGGGSLRGTIAVNANGVNGTATFSNLYYNLANPGMSESVVPYFTSPGLVSVTNSQFDVDFVSGLITLTNGNSLVHIDPNTQDGVFTWLVDGTAQLYQQWFWLRQDPGTAQISFDQLGTPLGLSWTPTNALIYYLPKGLDVTLSFTLKGGATGSRASSLVEIISIQNTTNSSAGLHVYDYTDFDLDGIAEGDTVSFPTTNVVVQEGKGMMAIQSVQGQTPNYWEASWYALTLDAIEDESPAILADEITPNEAGDQTFAYQWDVALGAGQTFVLGLTNNIQMDQVLLAIGLSGTNVNIWWPTNNNAVFNLQTSTLKPGSMWTNVPAQTSVIGANYQVTVPISSAAQFYRLGN
jgi:hypothetical protein